jgi:hypothetical protein
MANGKKMTIRFADLTFGFEMSDHLGNPIATDHNPKVLARKAFAEGAQTVAHDYDLRLAEDMD